jgi:cytidylate kinase
MQIVCISRGTLSGGKDLACKLASKLGSECISRETIIDAATQAGIPVGKLEMAVVRRRPLGEQLAIDKERYKAFVAATLCEKSKKGSIVYHGRTGHLVLPGVDHVLRARVIQDPERRISLTMDHLRLDRAKAVNYNEQVDEDRRRWIRTLYNIDWQDPSHYDTVINLSHLSVDNAAAALSSMAQLPEFQETPAVRNRIDDLLLASRCRLAIGADQRTRIIDATVTAKQGTVSVRYLPRQKKEAEFIPDVLRQISGVEKILCTMASTNLLWIQERFDPNAEALDQILEIAGKWDAAVELVKLTDAAAETVSPDEPEDLAKSDAPSEADEVDTANGGILDDNAEEPQEDNEEGLKYTRERLIEAGRAGGFHSIAGSAKNLLDTMDRSTPYSLVVVGNVFLSKSAAVRKRQSREMISYLSDNLKVPVIGADELKSQYLFGAAQWLKLFMFAALAIGLFALVFFNQLPVLEFLTREGTKHRILAAVALFVFVPLFAYVYGNFTGYLLRLLKFR